METTLATDTLETLLPKWKALLQGWALDGSLTTAAQEALMLEGTPAALQELVTQWGAGDFRTMPPIVLLSSAEMNGAEGAYAISTGIIYLNADWLATANQDQVNAVLTEELGHHLDGIVNSVDTPGDEGEYFAMLLSGQAFSDRQTSELKSEDDTTVLYVDSQALSIEMSQSINRIAQNLDSLYEGTFARAEANDITAFNKYIYISSADWGNGDDAVNVNEYIYNSTLTLGAGCDALYVGKYIYGSTVDFGDGDDIIAKQIPPLSFNGKYQGGTYFYGSTIRMGAGNDFAYAWAEYYYQSQFILGEGNDWIFLNGYNRQNNNSIVDGGLGYDIAAFVGSAASWGVSEGQDFSPVQLTIGGINIRGIEQLVFDDLIIYINDNTDAYEQNVYGTSEAYATSNYTNPIYKNNYLSFSSTTYGANTLPTGTPTLSGTFESGQVITIDKVSIQDADNISGWSPAFTYFWEVSTDGTSWSKIMSADATDNNTTYTLTSADVGKQVRGVVSYLDGYGTNEAVSTSATTTITTGNRAPTNITLNYSGIQENITAGSVVATLTSTDPDAGDTFTYTLVSGTGDSDNSSFTIVGNDIKINTSPNFENKSTYSVRIRSTDSGSLFTEKTFTLNVNNLQEDGSISAITSSTYNSQTFVEGATLTAGALTDPDNVAGPITYKWLNGTTEVQSGSSNTYTVGNTGEGTYRVEATYQDGTGSTVTAISANQAVTKVDNGQGILSAVTGNSAFNEGVILSAGAISADPDGNGTITAYQWYFNDALINGATSSSYTTSATGFGNYKVAVTYSDAQGFYSTLTSADQAVAKIDNGQGIAAAITALGGAPFYSGVTLVAGTVSEDPDGNATITSYQWYLNDSIINGATSSTYTTATATEGTYKVALTYSDAQGYSDIVQSANQTVTSPPDTTAPFVTSITTKDSTVIIRFSESISALATNPSLFQVQTVSSANAVTDKPVSIVAVDQNDDKQIILVLGGAAPASNVDLRVSYADPVGNQSTGVIQDLAGNDLQSFTDIYAQEFNGSIFADTLAPSYTNVVISGTTSADVNANQKNNTIKGNSAANVINGGGGDDTIAGGDGNDTLTGGNGNDTVDAGTGNDLIVGGDGAGDDAYNGGDGIDTVKYTSATTEISVDLSSGTASGNEIGTDTLTNIENVIGGQSNDTITGSSENNVLDGYTGADTLKGGFGDDTYVVDNSGDVVTENAGEGTDTVQSSISYSLDSNLENLALTGTSAINGTGNASANSISGNDAANSIDGGAGADAMAGAGGNDTYIVDNAGDIITENSNAGADSVQSSVSYTLSSNLENLTLSGTAAINATGNELNNTLTGNSAANVLDGSLGADTMNGGLSDDTYVVDNTGDVVTEAASAGNDTVQSSISYTLGSNLEKLTLTGSSAINGTGNTLANTLTGNNAANVLNGGTGADAMSGGLGDDTYIVDNTGDVVTEAASAGTDTVQSSLTYTLGANLENLTLLGSSAINGTGNALNNTIIGNNANNTLSGLAGNDTIRGEGGTDIIIGGLGADHLTGGAGTDTFRFALADSLLANYDKITDFAIGTDSIDGPSSVTAANVAELGRVTTLDQTDIAAVLTNTAFAANRAATFTWQDGATLRTFVALNNGTAGFQSSSDAIVEITGYSGLLTNLAIV